MVINAPLLLMLLLVVSPMALAGELGEGKTHKSECVVLLHGLWRTELSMKPLEWGLTDAGYTVVNSTYPSLSYPIEELAVMAVEEGVGECRLRGSTRIHFVTHSLGGILLRQYLTQRGIASLQRVVMLGPPNQGSQVADYVQSLVLLQPFTPEAVVQLGTGEKSITQHLGPVNFELGIIAGTANWRSALPTSPEGASDGTVAVAETIVPGMMDFLEMPVGHTFMMWDAAVLQQVIHFLRYGAFDRGVLVIPAS